MPCECVNPVSVLGIRSVGRVCTAPHAFFSNAQRAGCAGASLCLFAADSARAARWDGVRQVAVSPFCDLVVRTPSATAECDRIGQFAAEVGYAFDSSARCSIVAPLQTVIAKVDSTIGAIQLYLRVRVPHMNELDGSALRLKVLVGTSSDST